MALGDGVVPFDHEGMMTTSEVLTTVIATYAAVVATAVAVWDVIKWKLQGPSLSVRVRTGLLVLGDPNVPHDQTHIMMIVTNRGDRLTTILNMGFKEFRDDWVARWNPKAATWAAVVANPSAAQPLPFVLMPGQRWHGMCADNADLLRRAKDGCLMCVLAHSHTDKETFARVIFDK